MPEADRLAALEEFLAAYDRGEFFEAHEILEPAWMGAEDVTERELLQGLIKVAAAYVHASRGNPAGVEKNLRGALARVDAGMAASAALDVDAAALAAAIRVQLADGSTDVIRVPRLGAEGGAAGRGRRGG